MPLSASALVTWAQAKVYLGLDDTDQSSYEPFIEMASGIASRETRRKLTRQTITEDLDGVDSTTLLLSEYPVVSVESVKVDPLRAFGDGTAVTGFYVEPMGVVTMPSPFGRGKGIVRVSYTAGYDVAGGAVPHELQVAVLEIAVWLKRRAGNNQIGIRSTAGPDGMTTSWETRIPANAAALLENFTRRMF